MDQHQQHPKCVKQFKAVSKFLAKSKTNSIDLSACGSKENNALVALYRCETKNFDVCKSEQKMYENCHSSVMGVGTFENGSDCAKQLTALRVCVQQRKN
ncbi:hypothetical protein TrLO_g6638 [Triparma laevis f. longispina]|uniref:Uncharacterized protein n=1 Tax=Triparma laevis f. longispina TaxID=1714387 RepID=A0A9W7E557_9STRA|nr:hypothetical protein TrLO_g6638 [Triparma laevis f. longispina]